MADQFLAVTLPVMITIVATMWVAMRFSNRRFDEIDRQFDKIDASLDAMIQSLDGLNARMDGMSDRRLSRFSQN